MTERVRLGDLPDERAVEALGGTPRVVRLSHAAGESMPPHRHPDHVVVVYVLEGRLDLRPDGGSLELAAGELFRFEFTPVPEGSVPVFHEDVKVWEVKDKASGEHVGLWYLDPFARPGKGSGAWASTYRSHETFDEKLADEAGPSTSQGHPDGHFLLADNGPGQL